LPPKIVHFRSLHSFKRTVKLADFSSFLTRFQFLVFLYTSIFVFFADVSADVRACACTAWTAVNAVVYTEPCCSSSFTMCVYYCKMYLMSK